MFIFSKTDLGVLIKQQMRRRKELVQFFTTVIFQLPPTIPNKKSVSVASSPSKQVLLETRLSLSAAEASHQVSVQLRHIAFLLGATGGNSAHICFPWKQIKFSQLHWPIFAH